MRFEPKHLMAAIALTGLAGCSSVDPGLGEALRYDMAIQTVNPDPVYPEDGAQPGDNGEQGAKAVERYRKGETKELKIQTTSSAGGGGGGSSGGGSGPQ